MNALSNDLHTRAFVYGFVFRLGYECGLKNLANDAQFQESEHPRDKNGKFKSGTLSFDDYLAKHPELAGRNLRTQAKKYLLDMYRGDTISGVRGLPSGRTLKFSRRGLEETASFVTSSTTWVLPRLKEIYTNGDYRGSELVKEGKHIDTKAFHITDAFLKHKGKMYLVRAKYKEKNNELELDHYYVALL